MWNACECGQLVAAGVLAWQTTSQASDAGRAIARCSGVDQPIEKTSATPGAKGKGVFHLEPPTSEPSELDLGFEASLGQLQRLASVGVIAGSVVHEINNALTPVLAYAQLALSHPQDQELARKALQVAVRGVQHANQVAASVLSLVRAAETPSVALPNTNVLNTIKLAVEEVLAPSHMPPVRLEYDCDASFQVDMPQGELRQALVNLLRNATRACGPSGSIKVTCSTWNTPERPRFLCISVVDSGQGVTSGVRDRLFQPLATDPNVGGHGLGLMLSRRLARAAGGDVVFRAEHSPGARFDILIPESQPNSL